MTKTVKGAGRGRYTANKAKHDQRTPLPPRGSAPVHKEHTEALRSAAGLECACRGGPHGGYTCPGCRG